MVEKQEVIQLDVKIFGVLGQIGRHQQLHSVLLNGPVIQDVSPCYVGVDRHLHRGPGSRRHANQVYGSTSTLLLYMRNRFFTEGYTHQLTSDLVR
mgnify:CR=1 FL=1